MPGYDLATSDRSSLAPKYKCVSCKLLLRDAMQTSCGHFYCLSCLDNLVVAPENGGSGISDAQRTVVERAPLSPTMKCLLDDTIITPETVFPDNCMRREIMHLVVHCTFVELGCKWTGELGNLELHKNDCPSFPVVCPKCNKEGIPRAMIQEHQDPLPGDCDGVEAPCPSATLGCKEKKIQVHGNPGPGDGDQVECFCPFKCYGCQQKQPLTWRDLQQHLRESTASHVELTLVEIVQHLATREEVEWSSSDTKEAITQQFSGWQRQLEATVGDILQQVNSLGRQLEAAQETFRRLERKVESHEHVLAIRNVALADPKEFEFDDYADDYCDEWWYWCGP